MIIKDNEKFFRILIITSILCMIVLLIWWSFIDKDNYRKSKEILSNPIFTDASEIYLSNPRFNPETDTISWHKYQMTLLIFFSLDDCAICLYEAEYWAEVSKIFSTDKINIIGITNTPDKTKLSDFQSEYGITFPVLFDHNFKYKVTLMNAIYEKLNIDIQTPFKLIINSNWKLLYIEPATKNFERQKEFLQRVRKMYDSLQ
jgi:peroxiredoxin